MCCDKNVISEFDVIKSYRYISLPQTMVGSEDDRIVIIMSWHKSVVQTMSSYDMRMCYMKKRTRCHKMYCLANDLSETSVLMKMCHGKCHYKNVLA